MFQQTSGWYRSEETCEWCPNPLVFDDENSWITYSGIIRCFPRLVKKAKKVY